MKTTRLILTVLAVGTLLAPLGCNDDDNPANPGTPSGSADQPLAAVSLQGLELLNMMSTLSGAWWAGDLSGGAKVEPTWDPETMMWIFTLEAYDPSLTFPSNANIMAFVRLQYLADGVPQQAAEGANRMAVMLEVTTYRGIFIDENNNNTVSSELSCTGLFARGAGDGSTFSGTATGNIYGDAVSGGEFSEFSFDPVLMIWELALPAAGCPSGTFSLSAEAASFSAQLNGTATVSWSYTVTNGGTNSGTAALGCGG